MTRIVYPARTPDTRRKTNWRDEALCRMGDAEDFFPAGFDAKAQERHAKAICHLCPSRLPCGQWALDNDEPVGVWGGMTEGERRGILRRRRAKAAAAEAQPQPPKPAAKKREPAKCGTNSGYRRHVRDKTTICQPCRQAHADADSQLRRTGTTKAIA